MLHDVYHIRTLQPKSYQEEPCSIEDLNDEPPLEEMLLNSPENGTI
jgi:hypothetical protein